MYKIGRQLPSIQRESNSSDSPWLDAYLEQLKQGAQSLQSSYSIYEEINAIIGNAKPKFSSVEEAVKDLRERTGLSAFLDAKKAIAFIQNEPEIFKKIPEIKIFIDNFIDDHPGTSVDSVVHDLMKIEDIRQKLNGAELDESVKIYINNKLGEVQADSTDHNQVNHDIGKVDQAAHNQNVIDDPFAICEPSNQ